MKLAEDLRRAVLQAGIEGKLTGGSCEGWRFVRLGDIVAKRIKRGKSPKYVPRSNTLVFAQKCNTKRGNIDLSLALYLDESTIGKYPEEEFMLDGDIVLNSTGRGTLGRVGQYRVTDNPHDIPLVSDSHVTIIRPMQNISSEFVYYVLKHYQPHIETLGEGSTNQTELSAKKVAELLIPLPPLNEQHRIVSRLDSILPLIAELESAENELEALERKFPGDMRASLLQAAIQGELTGGTENWRWVRLGECALVGSGKTPAKDFLSSEGTVPFYRVADMNLSGNAKVMNEANTFLTEKYRGKLTPFPSVIFPKNGCAVFTNKRRFLNKPALIDLNTGYIFPTDVDIEYLFYWFSSIDLSLYAVGTALPTVNATIISNLIIPLPPIEEQHKIVSRLNELLPLCESLEKIT